jgi:hypothetical protein
VTRAAPCRAPSEDVSGVQEHMSKARGAFVHGPPGGTVADLRLRPAGRLNPGRFDRRRAMTAICAKLPYEVDPPKGSNRRKAAVAEISL